MSNQILCESGVLMGNSVDESSRSNISKLAVSDVTTIELANAYGLYAHGTWIADGVTVGNEEALAGRSAFLASRIREAIVSRFSVESLQK